MVSAERDKRNVQVPDHVRNPPHASPASCPQGLTPPPEVLSYSLGSWSPSASLAFYPPVALVPAPSLSVVFNIQAQTLFPPTRHPGKAEAELGGLKAIFVTFKSPKETIHLFQRCSQTK